MLLLGPNCYYQHILYCCLILSGHFGIMASNAAISQIKELLGKADDLREQLSNADRLQLIGLTDALSNELQRPDEAVFRITFNQVRST